VPNTTQTLNLLPGRFAVCRLPPATDAAALWPGLRGEVLALVRTPDELAVVCAEDAAPSDALVEHGWRCLGLRGPIPFATVGVLAGLAQPLAEAGVGIFVLSTFDTDYLLVKEGDLARACRALLHAGHTVAQP
jgi:hypothetical protein